MALPKHQPILFAELIDQCIDFLLDDTDTESQKTLRACLFISRAFFLRARPYFFKHVTLVYDRPFTGQSRREKIRKLHRLLISSYPDEVVQSLRLSRLDARVESVLPPLAPCIKSLTLDCSQCYRDVANRQDLPDLQDYITMDILKMLQGPSCSLTSFKLRAPQSTSFESIAEIPLAEALLGLWRSSTLRSLSLEHLSMIPASVLALPQLHDLQLTQSSLARRSGICPPSLRTAGGLPVLRTFVYCNPAVKLPLHWLTPTSSPFRSLRSLGSTPRQELQKILALCENTLEELTVHIDSGTSTKHTFPIHRLLLLRRLTFTVTSRRGCLDVSAVHDALRRCPVVPPSLLTLSLNLEVRLSTGCGILRVVNEAHWLTMDAILKERFGTLAQIEVSLSVEKLGDFSCPQVDSFIATLPKVLKHTWFDPRFKFSNHFESISNAY